MALRSVSQPFFSATQIRLNTLSACTAATQLSSHKKNITQKAVLVFHNINHHFTSAIFKIVTQHHSTLNALDALHPDCFYISLL